MEVNYEDRHIWFFIWIENVNYWYAISLLLIRVCVCVYFFFIFKLPLSNYEYFIKWTLIKNIVEKMEIILLENHSVTNKNGKTEKFFQN
jgi:hypothetical protein